MKCHHGLLLLQIPLSRGNEDCITISCISHKQPSGQHQTLWSRPLHEEAKHIRRQDLSIIGSQVISVAGLHPLELQSDKVISDQQLVVM